MRWFNTTEKCLHIHLTISAHKIKMTVRYCTCTPIWTMLHYHKRDRKTALKIAVKIHQTSTVSQCLTTETLSCLLYQVALQWSDAAFSTDRSQ